MKLLLTVLGALLILAGGVWLLQGINILPGSFMTGQVRWVIYGGITIAIGIGVLLFAQRRRSPPNKPE